MFRPIAFPRFASEVLLLYSPPIQAPATLVKMRQVLRLFAALPGVSRTSDLTAARIAAFVAARSGSVCTNTIVGELGYLAAACSYAVEQGWLARSPFASRRLRLREEPPAGTRHQSLAELARLLAALKARAAEGWPWDRVHVAASVVAHTGLRRTEALTLRVEDLDLAAGVLAVVARRRLKTVGSAAPVPVPPGLADVLAAWLPAVGSEWLIPNRRRSGPWTGGNAGYKPLDYLRRAGEAVGVVGVTWLSLRHSWATHAEVWGLGEAEIQRVLRHTRPLTQRRYRHADLANLQAIGARVRIG